MSKYFKNGAELQAAIDALPASFKGSFKAFDAAYYEAQHMASYTGTLTPLEHFMQIGAQQMLSPNANFDPKFYAEQYPDLLAQVAKGQLDGADLLVHYLKFGLNEGRAGSAKMAAFDHTEYLLSNPDVAEYVAANMASFENSMEYGARAHYVKFGQGEGRSAPMKQSLFTLEAVPPSVDKSFVWQGVNTDALQDMINYVQSGENLFNANYVTQLTDWIQNYASLTDEQVVFHPARLTPSGATNGVIEAGNTSLSDDTIVAGTAEALHGAYIDGGGGRNTLEVEMKGPFAQPKQLLNIQEIHVQNATDYYTGDSYDYNNANAARGDNDEADDLSEAADPGSVGLNNFLQNLGANSTLDLSNARQLDKLVVSESGSGDNLVILGIRNYATTKLMGGFDSNVTLHYGNLGTSDGKQLNLEMVNVDFGSTSNNGNLVVGHNAGVVSMSSMGASNVLNNVDLGNNLSRLVVTGDAPLTINESLEFANASVNIDASANTGGLRVSMGSQSGAALASATVVGSTANDNITLTAATSPAGANTATTINIDLGAGTNRVTVQGPVDAAAGSRITGENLTMVVTGAAGAPPAGATNMSRANIDGVDSIVVDAQAGASSLVVTAAQFRTLGADKFSALHRDTAAGITIAVTSDTSVTELLNGTTLSSNVKLFFTVAQGATLTMTAEQLHDLVATGGITMGNAAGQSRGMVVVTNAGLNFDVGDVNDVAAPGTSYGSGGTIINNWGANQNLTVVRSVDGFDRDSAVNNDDTLTIDTTAGDVTVGANALVDREEFNLQTGTLVIEGANDITFTAPVDFGGDNFEVDFSGLTGDLNGLTLVDFEDIAVGPVANWGEVIGNGVAGNRIDVTLSGNLGNAANGLVSSGVSTYVVTDLNGGNREFWVCDTTQGLTTLGLQGNVGDAVTFGNVDFEVSFLMEGDGQADWSDLPKAVGNPNTSNIGTLNAAYFLFDGNFEANVTVTNRGVALGEKTDGTPRELRVDGINIANVDTINVTVQDGDAIIAGISGGAGLGADEVDVITITSANDVELTLNASNSALETFDASGVAGDMTVNLPAALTINWGETEVSGVDAMVLGNGATVTLSIADVLEIGVADITVADPDVDNATINLVGLDETLFSVQDFTDGVNLGSITVAEQEDGVVTLDPATDLTGATSIIVPAGMTLNLTGTQYLQIAAGAANISGAGTVNITGITQANVDAGLNLSTITAVAGSLTFAGNVVLAATTNLGAATIDQDLNDDEDIADPGETGAAVLTEGADFVAHRGFSIDLADGQQITLAGEAQVHNRVIDGGAGTTVVLNFTAVGGSQVDPNNGAVANVAGLNLSYLANVTTVQVLPGLVEGTNVEQRLFGLDEDTVVVIDEPEAAPDPDVNPTFRNVEVAAGDTVGENLVGDSLLFENLNTDEPDFARLTKLQITLLGDATIDGNINVTAVAVPIAGTKDDGFDALTIVSKGDKANTIDDVLATGNNLRNVTIQADQDLTVNVITFSYVDQSAAGDNTATGDSATATLTVNGTKNVTIERLVTTDQDVTALNIVNNLKGGTLTVTGGSPGLDAGNTQSITISGEGNVVLDSDLADTGKGGINGAMLKSVDASGLKGSLTVGDLVASSNFTFKGAEGATTMLIGGKLDDEGLAAAAAQYQKAIGATKVVQADVNAAYNAIVTAANALNINDAKGKDLLTALKDGENAPAKAEVDAFISEYSVGWNLTMDANDTVTLDGATLTSGKLEVSGGTMVVDGVIDMTALTSVKIGDTTKITLAEGSALKMSDAQFEGLSKTTQAAVTGTGQSLKLDEAMVAKLKDGNTVDLTVIRGVTSLAIPEALAGVTTLRMTAEQAAVAFTIDAKGVRSTWDDDGDNDAKTKQVDRKNGDLSEVPGGVEIAIEVGDSNVDLSNLAGIDAIDVQKDTERSLTIPAAMLTELDAGTNKLLVDTKDGDVVKAVADIHSLSDLTLKVTVKDTTEGSKAAATASTIDTVLTENKDGTATTFTVSGHAAALRQASADDAFFGDFLEAATSVTHTGLGSALAGYKADGDIGAVGTAGVADTFVFDGVTTTSNGATGGKFTGVDSGTISGFTAGKGTEEAPADVVDLTAFFAAGSTLDYGNVKDAADLAAGVDANGSLFASGIEDYEILSFSFDTVAFNETQATATGNVAAAFAANGVYDDNGATTIFSANNAVANEKIFLIRDGVDTYIWNWNDSATTKDGANGRVDAAELTLVGVIDGLLDPSTLVAGNFNLGT